MFARIFATLSAAVLLLAGSAEAVPMLYSQSLGFTASQSMWGPGGSTSSFGASGSASVDPPFLPEVGAGYVAKANSGTASASVNGNLSASYDDFVHQGLTPIGLGFNPTTSSFGSSLGARFDITGFVHDIPFYGPWDFCFWCNNYSLDPSLSFTPVFGTWRNASDSFALAGVGPDIGVAAAQLNLNVNQTSYFRPDAVIGNLAYTHRDSGTTRSLGFSLSGLSVLSADLDMPGIWDFEFTGLDFVGRFDTTIGSNLSVDIDVFGVISESFPFGNVPLFSVNSFNLNFGSLGPLSAFSITVPEPGTVLLAVSGLLGLATLGRRRR